MLFISMLRSIYFDTSFLKSDPQEIYFIFLNILITPKDNHFAVIILNLPKTLLKFYYQI